MARELVELSLAERNQAFLDVGTQADKAILKQQRLKTSVWRTKIPRAPYTLGEGIQKKIYEFHPGVGPQRGLQLWHPIQLSKKAAAGDAGYDAAAYNPYNVTYGLSSMTYSGLGIEYATDPISIRDLRFSWQLQQQLEAIYGFLGTHTNEVWENYHREQYLYWANAATRIYVIGEGDPFAVTATYNPLSEDSAGDNVLTISMDALGEKIGILDWNWPKQYSRFLEMQAPAASIGASKNGRPLHGWVGDIEDFDKMIEHDSDLREDYRFAQPRVLIDQYGSVETFKGYTLMHDILTPRFAVKSVSGTTVTLKRVDPFTSSSATLTGNRYDVNADYLNAEFGMFIVFINDVFRTEIPPAGPANPGGGTVFGAAPGYNGEWMWINERDNRYNPLGEIGHFFMRAEAFSRPLAHRTYAIAGLYRRYVHTTPLDTEIGGTDAAAEQDVIVDAVTGDVDTTNNTVTLTLAGYLTAEAGDAIVLTDDSGVTDSGIVADSSNAPQYKLALATAPSAYTEYTAAGGCKVTVA